MNLRTKWKLVALAPLLLVPVIIFQNLTQVVPPTVVAISGSKIMLNGSQFISKGMIFEGFIQPLSWMEDCFAKPIVEQPIDVITGEPTIPAGTTANSQSSVTPKEHDFCRRHIEARHYYFGQKGTTVDPTNGTSYTYDYSNGRDALTLAVNNWKVNTVRFNINQAAIDPVNPYYNQDYVLEMRKLVNRARERNLIVILALFDYGNANVPYYIQLRNPKAPIDTMTSLGAAKKIASIYGADQGVFIEFLNEPYKPAKYELSQDLWLNGGSVKWQGSAWAGMVFPGMNNMIKGYRDAGGLNPIIIQGMSASLADIPDGLVDPQNKLIFSVHTFMNNMNWFRAFGYFSAKKPVIITAWNFITTDDWCPKYGVQRPFEFIRYLNDKNIGLVAYAFDVNYSATKDFERYLDTPSLISLTSNCTDKPGRGGLLMKEFFTDYDNSNFKNLIRANSGPSISGIQKPNSVKVGAAFNITVNINDADNDPVNARVWWKDNSASPSADQFQEATNNMLANQYSSSSVTTFSHTYANPGVYQPTVVVIDSKGAKTESIITINVVP